MLTLLEDLPNELMFEIFKYLNIRDLFYGFSQLNYRFNHLIRSIKNLSFIIEKNESKLLTIFANQIGQLIIKTSDNIDFNQFNFLYSLILYQLTRNQFEQIRSKYLPHLIHLSSSSITNSSLIPELIQRIFSNEFSSLRYVNLGSIYVPYYFSWSQSPSLRSISVYCSESKLISFILSSCPNLNFLQIYFLRNDNGLSHRTPIITNHPLKKFILIDSYHTLSFNDIEIFLSYMLNIQKISLKFLCDIPFINCIQIILSQLKYLHRFDCHIDVICDDSETTTAEIIQQMHPCFNRIRYLEDQHIFTTNCL